MVEKTAPRDHRKLVFTLVNRLGVLLIFLLLFARVAEDPSRKTSLIRADLRVSNLVQSGRTPGATRVMVFLSDLRRWQTLAAGGLMLGLILALWRRKAEVFTLALTMLLGQALVWLVKNLIHRSRPEPANAVAFESSYSFPSGHAFATFVFYGLVCTLLLPTTHRRARPLLIAASAVLVGDRILQGLSGRPLAVGCPGELRRGSGLVERRLNRALLLATSTRAPASEDPVSPPVGPRPSRRPLVERRRLALPPGAAPPAPCGPRDDPDHPGGGNPRSLFEKVPTHSEDLTGKPTEPIHVVIVSAAGVVGAIFRKAGWREADPIGLGSMSREIRSLPTDRPYPQQPRTPSFWNGLPNMLAFEHSTPANTIRERHHIHLWNTSLIDANRASIWVATVHFDRGLRRSASTPVPVDSIDPQVDLQRAYVRESLTATGDVASAEVFAVTSPTAGKNFAGDRFETDGKAVLLRLR